MTDEVRDIFGDTESPKLVYKPPTKEDLASKKATLGVKFSSDVFLSEAWMIKTNIKFELEDIEQTPLGRFARIKKDELGQDKS